MLVHSPDRRSPAWSTRSAATACAVSRFRRRRPRPHHQDVAEAFLARLDGSAFDAAGQDRGRDRDEGRALGAPRHRAARTAHRAARSPRRRRRVAALRARGRSAAPPISIERAIVMADSDRHHLEGEMARLERMLPVLLRPGGLRRGEVILSADEAWDLMSTTGPGLLAAGFDVRAPEISRRPRRPSLRVYVENVSESVVGANQLANVHWSALFDDVELTAADIAKLAKEARPLIRSAGRWVALDQVDLKAAAEALAQRDAEKQMSGGEMLRLALGLDDSPLSGRVSIEGGGWAADLRGRRQRQGRAGYHAARVRGRPAQLPGRGARMVGLSRLRGSRWLPRARHGSRQDADDARARARQQGRGPDARDRAARGRGQLARRGRALHTEAARGRAPRREPRARPTSSRPTSPAPTWS